MHIFTQISPKFSGTWFIVLVSKWNGQLISKSEIHYRLATEGQSTSDIQNAFLLQSHKTPRIENKHERGRGEGKKARHCSTLTAEHSQSHISTPRKGRHGHRTVCLSPLSPLFWARDYIQHYIQWLFTFVGHG